ncbi:MAG: transposase [Proteobacteria bacterium]|nr:transposase [Pseudomonadota bacterium]MBU1059639.1 transposase [Pseudomonadota bacterium]
MYECERLSHVRWNCKYHRVVDTKYKQKVLYSKLKRDFGEILPDLCRQRGEVSPKM